MALAVPKAPPIRNEVIFRSCEGGNFCFVLLVLICSQTAQNTPIGNIAEYI